MDENQIPESNQPQTLPKTSLKEQFTTVTPLSKFLAMMLFVALPFLGFWIGLNFAKSNNDKAYQAKSETDYQSLNGSLEEVETSRVSNEQVTENETNTNVVTDEVASTTNELAMKIYKNEEFGFEFKFPTEDFVVEEIPMTNTSNISLYVKIANKQSSGFLLVKKNLRNLDLSNYILDPYINCVEGTENPCLDAPKLMPFSFDGIGGLQEKFSEDGYGSYFFLQKDKIDLVYVFTLSSVQPFDEKVFKDILSTFSFR